MKYVVVIPDGMADYGLPALGGKSPMAAADKKNMNTLAGSGKVGMCLTVPPEMTPESDTANLALLGYDPLVYSRGRSPLEAASMGIEMMPEDTAVRVNLVALSDNGEKYEDKIMLDHSSDEISTEEARVLIEAVEEKFGTDYRRFYTGVSYRHCMIWKNCFEFDDFSRPHDIIGKQIGKYLPYKEQTKPMLELIEKTQNDFSADMSDSWYVLGILYSSLPGAPISFGNDNYAISYMRRCLDTQDSVNRSNLTNYLELADQLYKRNWNASKRAKEFDKMESKYNKESVPTEKMKFYEGRDGKDATAYYCSVPLATISDRQEALVILKYAIAVYESREAYNLDSDHKKAEEIKARIAEIS